MLKNMKIRTRMIVSYMIIVALLIIAGVVSIVMLNSVGNNLQGFYDNQFQTVSNAMDGRRSVFMVRAEIFAALLDSDVSDTQTSINNAEQYFDELKVNVANIRETFAGDETLLDTIDSEIASAEAVLPTILEHAMAVTNGTMSVDAAYEEFNNSYKPHMDIVRDNLATVGEQADENAQNRVDEGMLLATTATIVIIVLVVFAVVISIALALLISESIRKPVNEMVRVAGDIASGNLGTNITYQSKDELGDMANSMRQMTDGVRAIIKDVDHCLGELSDGNFTADSLTKQSYVGDYGGILTAFTSLRDNMNDTLTQIDVSADQVNSGGEQVSSSAQALAQGATEQASSVEELAATINEISHQVEATADHAKTAKTENQKSDEEIRSCSSHMSELMGAMSAIDNKSKEISKVIKTIEDIAFQTNILALNAAVEAARAGSAGKGFAVVADEVRNLANKSQEASKSTAALIDETIKAVDDGTRISGETDEALKQVVESARKVLDAVTLISEATEEQSRAVAQVTVGIDQISSVVQTNSATAEESAAASEELSGQANLLKELVARFTLRRGTNSHAAAAPARSSSADSFDVPASRSGDKY